MKSKGILIFSVIVVAMFCVLGLFARPMPFDEYGQHNGVVRLGIPQFVVNSYLRTNGRVMNHILMGLMTSFRLEKIQPFLPFITVITYIMALFSLLGTLFPAMKREEKFSLSFLLCAMTLCLTFSLNETFYWMPGMPYFWTTTLIVWALSLALKAFRGSMAAFWCCTAVLFLNGTMLEQPCVYQGVAAFLAMVYFWLNGERQKAWMAGMFWLVSIAAFCVMYFAPGTAVRMSVLDRYANAPSAQSTLMRILRGFIPGVSFGVRNAIRFFLRPIVWAVLLFVPAAGGKFSRRLKMWHIVAIILAIAVLMQSIAGAAASGSLPRRGISLSFWLMGFTWIMLWLFFYGGKLVNSESVRNFCAKMRWPALILAMLISTNFTDCVSAFRTAPEFAREWEARVESILSQRENGEMNLKVVPLKAKPGLIFSDINVLADWAQYGFAGYYGAKTICLVPEELSGNPEDVRKLISGDLTPYAKLAEKGDLEAISIMAGYRDPKVNHDHEEAHNLEEALRWYRLGAEQGDVDCARRLTNMIYKDNFLEALKIRVKAYIKDTRL